MAKNLWISFIVGMMLAPAWANNPYSAAEINSVQTEDEVKIQDLRNQEITQLKIALGRRIASNRQAELYLRLAELYLEGYRATFLLEGRVHEKRLQAGRADKLIDRSQSRPFIVLGLKASQDIINLRIPFERMDQVYYFLGFNYGELGNRKESVKYFEILAREYPRSLFVSEALRELGDSAFDVYQYRKALEYYEGAIAKGKELGSRYARVLHKCAWSYYKTRQFDKAVSTMKDAITQATDGGEKFLSLREEALRDMAIFMTETGRVDEAVQYFEKVADKNYYSKTLEKLARQYERNVEPLKALHVYESYLKLAPDEESQFKARVKLVDLDLRRGKMVEALKRLERAEISLSGSEELETVSQNLKAMIRRTATEHHELYRKNKSKEDLDIAGKYYSTYLDRFLTKKEFRKEIPEIQMYLAEVKKEFGKSDEASVLYREVIQSQDPRYMKEAALLLLSSLGELIKKTTPGDVPTAREREFVQAVLSFEEVLKDLPEGREGNLKAAQVLANYKKTQDEAIQIIQKIIEKWPASPQALIAARLWVQLYADSGVRSTDLALIMKLIRENRTLMDQDQKSGGKLGELLAAQDSRFRIDMIAVHEKKNDFSAAAAGYEAFASDSKSQQVAEKSLASAMTSYLKVSDFSSVNRIADQWLKRFPASKQGLSSIRFAATHALIKGQFLESENLFEIPGLRGLDALSLETAVRIQEGLGDSIRTQSLLSEYLKIYKKSDSRSKIQLSLAKSYEAAGKEREASSVYKDCMKESGDLGAECGARLADLYLRGKNHEQAKNIFKKIASFSGRGVFVAYARYRLALLMEEDAKFSPLELPDAKLKKALNARVAFITPLSKSYLSAVEAGGPWAIAALDRLASWVMNFANEVDQIAPPNQLSPEASIQFKLSLNKISEPLRKKARQTWKDAYQNALEIEILSPSLPQIVDRLGAMPRAQGFRGKFRLAGAATDGGKEGPEAAMTRIRNRLLEVPLDSSAWVDYGNLLWGEGKALLAKVAYERAQSIDPKNTASINNQGVLFASGGAEEDWFQVAQAMAYFKEALRLDDWFIAAKMNRGILLNYYRLFSKSKSLWEQVNVKISDSDALDSLGIAMIGMGQSEGAKDFFDKASRLGAPSKRFAYLFHGRSESCEDQIEDLEELGLEGFERESVDRMKGSCPAWKEKK